MAAWTFFGKVHPERVPVTLGQPMAGRLTQSAFGVEAEYNVALHHSQAIVTLSVSKGSPDIGHLRNIALDLTRQFTDVVGYVSGCHFQVEIVSAVARETNDWTIFGNEIPAVATRKNSHRGKPIDADLLIAIAASIPAQIALRDLQLAMQDAVGTGFYCYRAVEAMMQSMKTSAAVKDKAAWEQLNRALLLDRSASELIKRHADLPRHGKESSISDQERVQVFDLTDEIIHRFLEYIRRDCGPLPECQYPLLHGHSDPQGR